MDYKQILRYQPWLRFVNKHNISSRFLEYTHGDMFVAYNNIYSRYELHSCKSFVLTDSSCNGVLDDKQINGFAYTNFRQSELRKFMLDIMSENEKLNALYDRQDDKRTVALHDSLKQIQLTLGTKV